MFSPDRESEPGERGNRVTESRRDDDERGGAVKGGRVKGVKGGRWKVEGVNVRTRPCDNDVTGPPREGYSCLCPCD